MITTHPERTMKIALIGHPGVGKTALGKEIAERLELPFAGSDDWMEKKFGMSIGDIMGRGEDYFVKCEKSSILDLLASWKRGIISLSGSGFLYKKVRDALKDHQIASVWVRGYKSDMVALMEERRRNRPIAGIAEGASMKFLVEIRDGVYEHADFHSENVLDYLREDIEEILTRSWDDVEFPTPGPVE